MKALLDTNLLITYLLAPDKEGTIQAIIEAAFEDKYILLMPEEVISELKRKLTTKKYLLKHIHSQIAENFISSLSTIACEIPQIIETIPAVGRDLKDDYLLAYAVVGEADYLVSGDEDLQILKEIQGVKIVSPIEFLEILKKRK